MASGWAINLGASGVVDGLRGGYRHSCLVNLGLLDAFFVSLHLTENVRLSRGLATSKLRSRPRLRLKLSLKLCIRGLGVRCLWCEMHQQQHGVGLVPL